MKCKYCKQKVATESYWRSVCGWDGYPQVEKENYCEDPELCKKAYESRPIEVGLCEIKNIILRPQQTYKVICREGCLECERLVKRYEETQLIIEERKEIPSKIIPCSSPNCKGEPRIIDADKRRAWCVECYAWMFSD